MIASKTIRLEVPRAPLDRSPLVAALLEQESVLRRTAYRTTTIETNGQFFDDSDLTQPYSLIVVYDESSRAALLTARYYDCAKAIPGLISEEKIKEYILVDRMSANTGALAYRYSRNRIHVLFYLELLRQNRNRKILAMARKEPGDKLLNKYLSIGLEVIGITVHQGMDHWILSGCVEEYFRQSKHKQLLDTLAASENISTE
jgi:hypothetical protein